MVQRLRGEAGRRRNEETKATPGRKHSMERVRHKEGALQGQRGTKRKRCMDREHHEATPGKDREAQQKATPRTESHQKATPGARIQETERHQKVTPVNNPRDREAPRGN